MIFQNFGFNAVRGTTPQPPLFIEWLLVGAGGSSGRYDGGAFDTGGGGAGRFLSSSVSITPQEILVAIGIGGAAITSGRLTGNDGQSSIVSINEVLYIAPGGGGGGSWNSTGNSSGNGRAGGSGGGPSEEGNGNNSGGSAVEGTGLAGFGNDGLNDGGSVNGPAQAGGGAGTGAGGRAWVDGVTYCIGGAAPSSSDPQGTTAGCGGKGVIGGNNSNAGKDGIFIIRYAGSQKATGGTITSSGGYTYHTFTTDGEFLY
jgi:hypothetical protein